MEQYISKAAVIAEIKKLRTKWDNPFCTTTCDAIEEIINTLEVKEEIDVDLEKEIELVKGDYEQVDVAWNNDFDFIAKHFFNLGLQAKKGGES